MAGPQLCMCCAADSVVIMLSGWVVDGGGKIITN